MIDAAKVEAGLLRYEGLMERMSNTFRGRIRMKPLIGQSAGLWGISLGSFHTIERGLDVVFYVVVHTETETVLGGGQTKSFAIDGYRFYLKTAGSIRAAELCSAIHARWKADDALQRAAAREEIAKRVAAATPVRRAVPRRRRDVFEASGGCCHYCGQTLDLHGKWHVEHKMPRALMGGNEPGNLVASCVPCNMKKRDLTDVEFQARRSA